MTTGIRGFTLIEAMIALTILAILATVAVPAWQDAAAKVRDTSVRAALVEAIMRGSAHALATDTDVVLCPSADADACSGGTDWSRGWIAFADPDNNRQRVNTETLLISHPALDGGSRLVSTAGRKRMVLQAHGGNAGSNVTLTVCQRGRVSRASTLVVSNAGRWRLDKATPEKAIACAHSG